jgi:hypothetical protein
VIKMSEDQASGYLHPNGNATFFDEKGSHLLNMQIYGWCGLHLFYNQYYNAPVYFLTEESQVQIKCIEFLLKMIKKPKIGKKNDTIRVNTKRSS